MTDKKSGWQLGGDSSEAYERHMVPVHCVSRALDLGKRIGPEARDIMRTPFVTKSVDEVRSWLQDAGFNEVRVAIRFDTVRFPSIEEFVRREIECMPVPQIQTEMNRNREAIVSDVSKMRRSYVDDYGLACHVEDYVATAKK